MPARDRENFIMLFGKSDRSPATLKIRPDGNHFCDASCTGTGENIGDLGGLGIAYQAWVLALDGREPEVIDGETGAQRLFLNWARAWRTQTRPAEVLRRLSIDPHSPPEFRCNQVVRNLDEYYEAFGVTETDAMWLDPADRVRIW